MIYVGIDNGVTGSLAALNPDGTVLSFTETPVYKELRYTKAAKFDNLVDIGRLRAWLLSLVAPNEISVRVFMERPFINPKFFWASLSAIRAHDACRFACLWPLRVIDSREWQRSMLPSGLKGAEQLKAASRDLGMQRFPSVAEAIRKHGDADSLFIAEQARRNQW